MSSLRRPDLPHMSLLRQFAEVALCKSIAKAARQLNMTQPTLSKNLKRLEQSIGIVLFERHSRGSVLTEAGETLYARAATILTEYELALEEARTAVEFNGGILRIGAGPVFASTILPLAIPIFQERFPHIQVAIQYIEMEDCEDALKSGIVHVAAGAILKPISSPLAAKPLRRAKLGLICRDGHPLNSAPGPVSITRALKYPFVLFAPDRDLVRRITRDIGERGSLPLHRVETTSLEGAIELVRNSDYLMLGSLLLTEFTVGKNLVSLPVDIDLGDYEMGFLFNERNPNIAAVTAMINISYRILDGR